MFWETFDLSAFTNALPITPGPGGSIRPRAKTTSTGGQLAAAATPAAPGIPEGSTAAVSVNTVAITTGNTRTSKMVEGERRRRRAG